MPELKLKDWLPQEPWQGPPLPELLNIYWPFYEPPGEEVPPEEEPPAPAEFTVTDLVIEPAEVEVGKEVTISCKVMNIGGTTGSYIVHLTGDFTAEQNVTLSPGSERWVYFKVTPGTAKTYSVSVNGLPGAFTAVAPAPVVEIVSVTWGTKAEQGGTIAARMIVRSNFAGTAWPVMAYGKGSPGAGASFSPHNDCGGNYAGWFPDGFKLCPNAVEYYGLPYVGSVELEVGDNVIEINYGIPQFYPLGTYTTYCAIMPPAKPETPPGYDWYHWPAPYDWKMGNPFTVVKPPLPVTAEIAIIQRISIVSWSATVYPMREIHGRSGEGSNYIDGKPGERRIPIGEYMKFRKPCPDWTCDVYEPDIPDLAARIRSYWESAYGYAIPTEIRIRFRAIALYVYVESHGPPNKWGWMQEYPFTATGWLTYPDGHTETGTLTSKTPWAQDHLYQNNMVNYGLPLGPGADAGYDMHQNPVGGPYFMALPDFTELGTYRLRVKLVCEGKQIMDKTVNFKIEAI